MDEQVAALVPLIPALRGKTIVCEQLSGGLTNRNYRVSAGDQRYVLRIVGADTALLGIDRAREVACQGAAAAAGLGPRVLAFLAEPGAILSEFVAGRTLALEDFHDDVMVGRVAAVLRLCHAQPLPAGVGAFSVFQTVRDYLAVARQKNVPLPADLGRALAQLAVVERELSRDAAACLCHNDLLPANFIDDGGRLRLIDWEYAGAGDCFFDLANLAVNLQLKEKQEHTLLTAYFGAARPDDLRRLRLMRLASDLREAMWGFVQAGISKLHTPPYYLDYAARHLERCLASARTLDGV
jgi:thiamine kinase-like enzyme